MSSTKTYLAGVDEDGAFLSPTTPASPNCRMADTRLLGMSGLELRDFVREGGKQSGIVFISADDLPVMREEGGQGGCLAHFHKPMPKASPGACKKGHSHRQRPGLNTAFQQTPKSFNPQQDMKPNQLLPEPLLNRLVLAVCVLLVCSFANADVLELKGGKVLNGKYVGGTAGTIRFETGGGIEVIETSQALALTFSGGSTAAPASSAPDTGAASSITINAGTVLLVRMVDPASSKDPQGKRFTTTLESDLVVNGTMVARAGTKVYGRVQGAKQAGRYAGQSSLDLRLSEIAIGSSLIPITTGGYTQSAAKSIGKTAKGAAAGAAIGAIADGGEGAGKGAAIGAVASGLKKGQAVVINPGTLLEFKLEQPLTVKVTP